MSDGRLHISLTLVVIDIIALILTESLLYHLFLISGEPPAHSL